MSLSLFHPLTAMMSTMMAFVFTAAGAAEPWVLLKAVPSGSHVGYLSPFDAWNGELKKNAIFETPVHVYFHASLSEAQPWLTASVVFWSSAIICTMVALIFYMGFVLGKHRQHQSASVACLVSYLTFALHLAVVPLFCLTRSSPHTSVHLAWGAAFMIVAAALHFVAAVAMTVFKCRYRNSESYVFVQKL